MLYENGGYMKNSSFPRYFRGALLAASLLFAALSVSAETMAAVTATPSSLPREVIVEETELLPVLSGGKFEAVNSIAAPAVNVPTNTRTGIRVSWETVKDAVKYCIYRSEGAGAPSWKAIAEVNASSADSQVYLDEDATESGAWYAYTVTALSSPDSAGKRTESARPGGRAVRFLAPPEIVSANFTGTRVKVIWKTVKGAFKYRLYRKNAGETEFSKVMDVVDKENADTLFWVDTQIPLGSSCQYYVRVVDGEGTKPYSSFLDPVKVTTGKPVTGVTLNLSQKTIGIGETLALTAAVKPSDAMNKKVSWSSKNTAVATVNAAGVVTAKSPGTATITATTEMGKYTASCKVTVRTRYSIIYKLNGGTNGSGNPNYYDAVTPKTTLANASRTGYTFGGWYKDSAFKTKVTSVGGGATGNLTLYAKWTPYHYTVNYVLNGGKNNTANPASYTIEDETVILKDPIRTGYLFKGWFKESSFKTQVYRIWKGSHGSMTLYAKWAPISYTVSFNRNGGKGSMLQQLEKPKLTEVEPGGYRWIYWGSYDKIFCKYDSSFTIPLCDFVRPGYYCTHWNTKPDGTGTSYEFLQSVKNIYSTNGENITLYPVWKAMTSEEKEYAAEVFRLVNKTRADYGFKPLLYNEDMSAVAQQRAYELTMLFSHDRPDGRRQSVLVDCAFGPSKCAAGENIAYGFMTPSSVMDGWMDSPGHRDNMLGITFKYSHIGVGCVDYHGICYWVQTLGKMYD